MINKKPNIILIILSIIFFPITLIALIIKACDSTKQVNNKSEKSFILGETDEPNDSYIDMMFMDDD